MRKSGKGNPWHYPAGHPRGGQFAPAGTVGAVACVGGMRMEREQYVNAVGTEQFEKRCADHYDAQTDERWNREPSEAQIKQAERIAKKSGEPLPKEFTAIAYADYNEINRPTIEAPSEKQARAMRYLEEETGIPIPHNAHALSEQHSGAFIGAAKEVQELRDENNWTKEGNVRSCGKYRVVSHDGVYRTEKKVTTYTEVVENGKTVRKKRTEYVTINDGKKNPHEAMRFAANDRLEEYKERYSNKESRRRSKDTVETRQETHRNLAQKDKWDENNGVYTNGEYTIEMGETGLHVYRTVDYEKQCHGKVKKHSRQEWVGSGFKTPEEAMDAAVKHDAKVYKREINPNAASDAELIRWGFTRKVNGEVVANRSAYKRFCELNSPEKAE